MNSTTNTVSITLHKFFSHIVAISLFVWLTGCASDTADTDNSATQKLEPLVWNVSLWGKPRAGTEAAETLAREVESATDGAWQIELHYGEALSKSRENLDGLSIGAFEAAMACNFYHPQKTPALMVLSLPFIPITDWESNQKVRGAVYAHPIVQEELARWGAMSYTSTFLPQYEFLGSGDPPLTMEDWEGKTVRAGGGLGEAMRLLGAVPSSSTATEVYTGVQQGTMDAASFPMTYSHVAYRIHEVSNWFTSNFAPGTADCVFAFAIPAYERLSPEYKQLLEDIRPKVDAAQIQAYIDVDEVNFPMLREDLIEVTYTAEQRAAVEEQVGKKVIADWIEAHQDQFDAHDLVSTVYAAVGQTYD